MNQFHYGVVVGINRYPDIRHLQRAKGDAEKFAKWLHDPDGGDVPVENVVKVIVEDERVPDDALREDAIPTRREVFNAIHKFRKRVDDRINRHPEDWDKTRLYFYVSGHGIAPDVKDAALLMADAGGDWYGENISCARLLSFLGKAQTFREVVVFADCCRERVPSAPIGDVPWTLVERNNGHVLSVLGCATYFGDLAFEPPRTESGDDLRGYFTQALLEGLRGEAADSASGEVNSNSLARYVRQRVMDLTGHLKHPQTPTMEADPAEPIVFRRLSANTVAPRHDVRLRFETPNHGIATLRDSDGKILGRQDTGAGVWVVNLANGLYEVTVNGASLKNNGLFKVWGEGKDVVIQHG